MRVNFDSVSVVFYVCIRKLERISPLTISKSNSKINPEKKVRIDNIRVANRENDTFNDDVCQSECN